MKKNIISSLCTLTIASLLIALVIPKALVFDILIVATLVVLCMYYILFTE